MRQAMLVLGTGLIAILTCGCQGTGSAAKDQDVELRATQAERDQCAHELAMAQANYEALDKRMDSVQRKWDADRATAMSLRAELKKLGDSYDKLRAVYAQFEEQEITRPDVPLSPLPTDIDTALMTFAQKVPDRVWYDRARGALSFANDKLFDVGSDTVRADAYAALDELAGILASTPTTEYDIVVVGHTDDLPIRKEETLARHPSNWHLSVDRAIAVLETLVKGGLPASRCSVAGYGPYRPVSEDRAKNRRVEIFIVRKGAVQSFAPVRAK